MSFEFQPDEGTARILDERDPLAPFRRRFRLPPAAIYFAGNSLGLQPVTVERALRDELEAWATRGVDAHFQGARPWVDYEQDLREPLGSLVGAEPREVAVMNGLTVNLHLMLVTFYRPTATRYKVLMEDCAFPSDTYAVRSQIAFHGHDPDAGLIVAGSDLVERIEREGDAIALVLLGAVSYFTGQLFDIEAVADAARARGCAIGIDAAHAVGNVPLRLHDWGVDFAVWCSYKYLNAGPGAVAGCFVHARHLGRHDLPRLAGWWGHDPRLRFRMHLEPRCVPRETADAWQLSNPPILAAAPLRESLEIFDEAGIDALRAKSRLLTGYLEYWIDRAGAPALELLTPRQPARRGCQLSLRVREQADAVFAALRAAGVVGDFRPPDVVRLAPVPLYNTFHEVWRVGQVLARREPGVHA